MTSFVSELEPLPEQRIRTVSPAQDNAANNATNGIMASGGNQTQTNSTSPPQRPDAEEEDLWESHGWWIVLSVAGSSAALGVAYGMRSFYQTRSIATSEMDKDLDNLNGVVCETSEDSVVDDPGGSRLVKFLAEEREKTRGTPPSVVSTGTHHPLSSPTTSSSLSVATDAVGESWLSSLSRHSSGAVDPTASTSSSVALPLSGGSEPALPPPPSAGERARRRVSVSSVISSRRNSVCSLPDDDETTSANVVVLAKKFRVEVDGKHTASSGASRIVFGYNLHNRQRVAVKLFKNEKDFERERDFLMELQEPTKVIPLCDRPIYGHPPPKNEGAANAEEENYKPEDHDKRLEKNLALFFPEFPAGGLVLQHAERNMQEFVETRAELTLHEALLWGQQMVASLAWIHSRNILWADCKLANYLLVLEPGSVVPVLKACDFGTSLEFGELFPALCDAKHDVGSGTSTGEGEQEHNASAWDWASGVLMTARGLGLGEAQDLGKNDDHAPEDDMARFGVTPQYAPPERVVVFYGAKSKTAGPQELRAHNSYDMWALGVCLYRILAGFDLFDSEETAWDELQDSFLHPEVFEKQLRHEKLSPVERRNESAARLLKDLLVVNPALRPTANKVLGRALFRGGSTINAKSLYSRMRSGFSKLEEKVDRAADAV